MSGIEINTKEKMISKQDGEGKINEYVLKIQNSVKKFQLKTKQKYDLNIKSNLLIC